MLSNLFMQQAVAADTTEQFATGGIEQILLLGGFVLIFYFIIWRPQSKRNKAHKALMANLAVEAEVVAAGGIVGTIIKLDEQFAVLKIDSNSQITVQRSAVSLILPTGSIDKI